jgi:hypothetical protein
MIERPKITQEIIIEAAKKTAENASNLEADEKKRLAADIADCYHSHMDGYELCKKLENKGWMINTMFVEDMDSIDSFISDVHRKVCWEWVKENNIQPPFPIGTIIKEGEITDIYDHLPAYYSVKPIGQDDPKTGKRRSLVKFESAIPVDESVAKTSITTTDHLTRSCPGKCQFKKWEPSSVYCSGCNDKEKFVFYYIFGPTDKPMTDKERNWCMNQIVEKGEGYYNKEPLKHLTDHDLAIALIDAWRMYNSNHESYGKQHLTAINI